MSTSTTPRHRPKSHAVPHERFSISLPVTEIRDLDREAEKLQTSRNAIINRRYQLGKQAELEANAEVTNQ